MILVWITINFASFWILTSLLYLFTFKGDAMFSKLMTQAFIHLKIKINKKTIRLKKCIVVLRGYFLCVPGIYKNDICV